MDVNKEMILIMNKQLKNTSCFDRSKLQKQNLRALTKELFLNLMSVDGIMKKTIIRNFNNKKTNGENNDSKQLRNLATNCTI